jgi:hypothetical protein
VDVALQQPADQARSFAMVSGAVYDAVNAIDGSPREPYLVAPPAQPSYSKDAAVAAAAHRVLLALAPDQQSYLDQQYAASLAAIPDGAAETGGVNVGRAAADAMIGSRENDGYRGAQQWIVGNAPGEWRVTAPFFFGAGAYVAFSKPFVIPANDMFRFFAPNALSSTAYANDFNEVKSLGSATSTTRTADQTEAALFWDDIHVPWWDVENQLIANHNLSISESARMLALANISAADAMFANFNNKYHWHSWRPITAIAEAASDGNPATTADPNWTPLLATPPFPEHPAGHPASSSGLATGLGLYFGRDDVTFSAYSPATGTTRSFGSFSSAITEIINARIWGGIHFRRGGTGAIEGATVATYVWSHALRRTA